MPCPTCGHTMANLGIEEERKFYCTRCGTVKTEHKDGFEDIQVPMLVGRVRSVHHKDPHLSAATSAKYLWRDALEAIGIKIQL